MPWEAGGVLWALAACSLSASAPFLCPDAAVCSAALEPEPDAAGSWGVAGRLLDAVGGSAALGAEGACELPAGADSAASLALEVALALATTAAAGAALATDAAAFGAALLLCAAHRDCMPPATSRQHCQAYDMDKCAPQQWRAIE